MLRDAIDQARAAGILVVTAAGNSATNLDSQPTYPAGFGLDNVITVAATTRTDQLAAFSNFGAHTVDLAAPGVDIFSTYYTADNGYATLSGTSMAAPLVSGAFALLRARYPAETYHQLINRLLSTTDELLSLAGKCVTGGRLNLARALGPTFLVNFAPSVGAGFAPLNVTFTNTTAGKATRWDWDFGDGTAHDTNQNPAHRFTQVGKFSVTLTAANDRATNVFSRALAVERAGVISAYTTIGAGQFELHFVGQAAQAYAVLASTNLSDWTPVGTNVAAADGTFLFLDQFAGNFSRRFYRTVELPPAP